MRKTNGRLEDREFMSLAERKHPLDLAPDWVEQTYGERLFNALMTLRLFEVLTKEESLMVLDRIDKWAGEYILGIKDNKWEEEKR